MHFQKLDLNLLVVFRSLMTYRSVTGAAGALNLTQSAASHALSRLRRFYADPLFVRNGQTMGPTARAFEIDQDVQEALAKIARTFKTEFDPRHLAREFRIALVNFGGLYMVPALLGKLATEAPDVHVHVDHVPPEKAVKRLEQGELDFLIGDLMGRKASIETVHLLTDEFCVVAASGHSTIGSRLSIRQLSVLEHIHVSFFAKYEAAFTQQGIKRKFASSTDNLLSALFLVGRSQTIAVVPRTVARIYSGVYQLKILALPAALPPMNIDLAFRRADRDDAAHRWLREIILDIAVEIGLTFGTAAELISRRRAG